MEERDRHIFLLGHINEDRVEELKTKITELDGEYVVAPTGQYSNTCTHVITEQFAMTERYMAAMAAGKWFVSPEYIFASYKYNTWLQESLFEYPKKPVWDLWESVPDDDDSTSDTDNVKKVEETNSFKYTPKRCREEVIIRNRPLFSLWRVVLCVQNSVVRNSLEKILQCGAATILSLADFLLERSSNYEPSDELCSQSMKKLIIVCTEEDNSRCGDVDEWRISGVYCVHYTYIEGYMCNTNADPLSFTFVEANKNFERSLTKMRTKSVKKPVAMAFHKHHDHDELQSAETTEMKRRKADSSNGQNKRQKLSQVSEDDSSDDVEIVEEIGIVKEITCVGYFMQKKRESYIIDLCYSDSDPEVISDTRIEDPEVVFDTYPLTDRRPPSTREIGVQTTTRPIVGKMVKLSPQRLSNTTPARIRKAANTHNRPNRKNSLDRQNFEAIRQWNTDVQRSLRMTDTTEKTAENTSSPKVSIVSPSPNYKLNDEAHSTCDTGGSRRVLKPLQVSKRPVIKISSQMRQEAQNSSCNPQQRIDNIYSPRRPSADAPGTSLGFAESQVSIRTKTDSQQLRKVSTVTNLQEPQEAKKHRNTYHRRRYHKHVTCNRNVDTHDKTNKLKHRNGGLEKSPKKQKTFKTKGSYLVLKLIAAVCEPRDDNPVPKRDSTIPANDVLNPNKTPTSASSSFTSSTSMSAVSTDPASTKSTIVRSKIFTPSKNKKTTKNALDKGTTDSSTSFTPSKSTIVASKNKKPHKNTKPLSSANITSPKITNSASANFTPSKNATDVSKNIASRKEYRAGTISSMLSESTIATSRSIKLPETYMAMPSCTQTEGAAVASNSIALSKCSTPTRKKKVSHKCLKSTKSVIPEVNTTVATENVLPAHRITETTGSNSQSTRQSTTTTTQHRKVQKHLNSDVKLKSDVKVLLKDCCGTARADFPVAMETTTNKRQTPVSTRKSGKQSEKKLKICKLKCDAPKCKTKKKATPKNYKTKQEKLTKYFPRKTLDCETDVKVLEDKSPPHLVRETYYTPKKHYQKMPHLLPSKLQYQHNKFGCKSMDVKVTDMINVSSDDAHQVRDSIESLQVPEDVCQVRDNIESPVLVDLLHLDDSADDKVIPREKEVVNEIGNTPEKHRIMSRVCLDMEQCQQLEETADIEADRTIVHVEQTQQDQWNIALPNIHEVLKYTLHDNPIDFFLPDEIFRYEVVSQDHSYEYEPLIGTDDTEVDDTTLERVPMKVDNTLDKLIQEGDGDDESLSDESSNSDEERTEPEDTDSSETSCNTSCNSAQEVVSEKTSQSLISFKNFIKVPSWQKKPDYNQRPVYRTIKEIIEEWLESGEIDFPALEIAHISVNCTFEYLQVQTMGIILKQCVMNEKHIPTAGIAMSIFRSAFEMHPPINRGLRKYYLDILSYTDDNNVDKYTPWKLMSKLCYMVKEGEDNPSTTIKVQYILMIHLLLQIDFRHWKESYAKTHLFLETCNEYGYPLYMSLVWASHSVIGYISVEYSPVRELISMVVTDMVSVNYVNDVLEDMLEALAELCYLHRPCEKGQLPSGYAIESLVEEIAEQVCESKNEYLVDSLSGDWFSTLVSLSVARKMYLLDEDATIEDMVPCLEILSLEKNPIPVVSNSEQENEIEEMLLNISTTPDSTSQKGSPSIPNFCKKNGKGETILHRCCISNNPKQLALLLTSTDDKLDVNISDFGFITPLHEAVNRGRVECVKVLLNYKPKGGCKALDLNSRTHEGFTPILDAVRNNRPDLVSLLVDRGGCNLLRYKDSKDQGPLQLCTSDEMRTTLLKFMTEEGRIKAIASNASRNAEEREKQYRVVATALRHYVTSTYIKHIDWSRETRLPDTIIQIRLKEVDFIKKTKERLKDSTEVNDQRLLWLFADW